PRWVLILGIADVLSVSVTGLGGGWATLSVLPGPVMRRAPPPGRERATCPYVCLVPESATPAEPGPPSMAARAWACNGGGAGLLLLGRDHHHHLPPLEARPGFDDDVLPEILLDPLGHLATQLLVAHLAATEADVDLDLVALFEELAHLAHLDRVVAGVGDGAELHFLDFDLLLLLLGRVGLLLQVEHVLAEVHDPADRRVAVRLDLDQVKARLLGGRERLVAREHAKHLAFTVDHAYPRDADLLVPSVSLVGGADVAISVGVGPAGGPCSHCAACFSARPRCVDARRTRRRSSIPGPPLRGYAPRPGRSPSHGHRPRAGTARAAACARGSYSRSFRCANRIPPGNLGTQGFPGRRARRPPGRR